jgi:hypothetical protein
MAVVIGKNYGLNPGGQIVVREIKAGKWVVRGTIKDGGPGDSDRKKNGVITYGGAANLTTYVQVDTNGRFGDDDIFWKVSQNRVGADVRHIKMVPATLNRRQNMKPGATIEFYDVTGKKLLSRVVDNSGGDLDLSGNGKFSTLVGKNQNFIIKIKNKDGTIYSWRWLKSGMGAAAGERFNLIGRKGLPPIKTPLNQKRIADYTKFCSGAINAMNGWIAKKGSNPSWEAYYRQANNAYNKSLGWLANLLGKGYASNAGYKSLLARGKAAQQSYADKVNPFPRAAASTVNAEYIAFIQTQNYAMTDFAIAFPPSVNAGQVANYNSSAVGDAIGKVAAALANYKRITDSISGYRGTWQQLDNELKNLRGMTTEQLLNSAKNQLISYMDAARGKIGGYVDAIVKAVKLQRADQERQRLFAILNIIGGVISGVAGAVDVADKILGASTIKTALVASKSADLYNPANTIGQNVDRLNGFKSNVDMLQQSGQLPNTSGLSGSLKEAFDNLFNDIRKAEAKVAKLIPSLQYSEESPNDSAQKPGGPGWNADLGMFPSSPDIGYTEANYRGPMEGDSYTYGVRRTYYRHWLLT